MKDQNTKGKVVMIIAIVFVVALVISIFSADSKDKYDVAHDPNGFLGYSDEFWEWYDEHN